MTKTPCFKTPLKLVFSDQVEEEYFLFSDKVEEEYFQKYVFLDQVEEEYFRI